MTRSEINTKKKKKVTSRDIIFKLLLTKDKVETVKTAREKRHMAQAWEDCKSERVTRRQGSAIIEEQNPSTQNSTISKNEVI
jgi:hypothetical protein